MARIGKIARLPEAVRVQLNTRRDQKAVAPGERPIVPCVPDQASIVLKRAKTRYFFAARPCHYSPNY